MPGEIPIINDIYLVVKDFNSDSNKMSVIFDGVKMLSYFVGELVLITLAPNRDGWFEGYRANDPQKLCGIGHIKTLKKINY